MTGDDLGRPLTIRDVARHAGVSISTVSRVMNGKNVRPELKVAVQQVLSELDFRPSAVARSMVRGTTQTVGVLIEDISSAYYAELIKGIESVLERTGHHPLFKSSHWSALREDEALKVFLDHNVDAIIVVGGFIAEDRLRELSQRLPLVVVGRSGLSLEVPTLTLDQHGGAYRATRHLIELGHREIVHICGRMTQEDAVGRLQGYYDAMRDAGLDVRPEWVLQGDFLETSAYRAMLGFVELNLPFTAVFAANDQMAFGANLALHRKGLRVPDDVSLVGYDDLPMSAYIVPPLTTIRQPAQQVGEIAARAAHDLMTGKTPQTPNFELRLVLRESTRPLRR
ncbi:transcriptional regulator [Deinococcus irradiatisoli]|uniref:Transcriptional regulator n=1 Tax=Deinococcus irradiatisoli TaxID=2202254 RepID=A0A2Z3JH11_9DEIO|nr:LacI family DNA-binding transcriptional regulator [Deinococcus irradiatisoli]AWN22791.1 transcriptional regulator [Deinococcus irradiatisoli]